MNKLFGMKAITALTLLSTSLLLSGLCHASEANARKFSAQAKAQLDAGNISRAELLYAQAMQESPNDTTLSMQLAEIYISQRRFDEADRLIAKTQQSQPSDYRVWKARGELQLAQGNEAGAIESYEKSFSLGGKEDAFVLQNLQQHYERTGNATRKKQMENNLLYLRKKNGTR